MTQPSMPLPAIAQEPTSVPPAVLLANHLKALKLPTFVREYEKLALEAARDQADYPRYLLRLCELERIDRERRMVERRIRLAKFPHTKSFDTFDFTAQPSLNRTLVLELARGEWIEQRRNVIALGPSGTGKTHAALALGLVACQKGHSVAFTTAAALVHDLMEARDERRLRTVDSWRWRPLKRDDGAPLFLDDPAPRFLDDPARVISMVRRLPLACSHSLPWSPSGANDASGATFHAQGARHHSTEIFVSLGA